jgi:ABC-type multidrug transport system fused ATPase/permease subunit
MNDFSTIVRSLFPALKPSTWAILGSLAITSLVIATDLFQPYGLKLLLDAATLSRHYRLVVTLLLVLLVLALLRSYVSYWEGYARSSVGEAIAASYRQRLFAHVLQVTLGTLQEAERGVWETRMMNDPGTIGRVYVNCFPTSALLALFDEGAAETSRLRLGHAISRLRGKLWPQWDIASLRNVGYLLLTDPPETSLALVEGR